jgi:hypothetical protein
MRPPVVRGSLAITRSAPDVVAYPPARKKSRRRYLTAQAALGNLLKTGAPATQVKSTIDSMIEELGEDIEGELK